MIILLYRLFVSPRDTYPIVSSVEKKKKKSTMPYIKCHLQNKKRSRKKNIASVKVFFFPPFILYNKPNKWNRTIYTFYPAIGPARYFIRFIIPADVRRDRARTGLGTILLKIMCRRVYYYYGVNAFTVFYNRTNLQLQRKNRKKKRKKKTQCSRII